MIRWGETGREDLAWERIYLDNASTTFPKRRAAADAMYGFVTQLGSNINRGGYDGPIRRRRPVYETRQRLCALFGGQDCRNVVFTKNVTESLNVLLKGLLQQRRPCAGVRHGAQCRHAASGPAGARGVAFSRVPCGRGRESAGGGASPAA